MVKGIKDKVAVIGMGCSVFGERWDTEESGLVVEAFEECLADAGVEKRDIEAAWFGSCIESVNVGSTAMPLADFLHLPYIPVTRVENACCTGTEAFRGACYAVACGAYDICLAVGAEKLKDTGYGGLPARGSAGGTGWINLPNMSAPGMFAQLASAYAAKYKIPPKTLKEAIGHVSWKSHQNGAKNPKAHLRKAVSMEQILAAPMVAAPLGLFDCCGVSDGSACAIVTTPEIAKKLGKKDFVTVKAVQLSVSSGEELGFNEWDGEHLVTTARAGKAAYAEAGITDPENQISMIECHDCFSITELVTYEDLQFSRPGQAWKDALDGKFDANGKIPCQIDGGLKCFGHPIGSSGLRMLYEMYLQLHGRAGERQLPNPKYGLTHNLGGMPSRNVAAVCIIGKYEG
ncbi:MAG: acetyl-CoA acetyltransferase [Deltaproteobacteria bacterium]|nr:acetyl-CoA acetyltransferase [Deltaproteobacteria bacterium]